MCALEKGGFALETGLFALQTCIVVIWDRGRVCVTGERVYIRDEPVCARDICNMCSVGMIREACALEKGRFALDGPVCATDMYICYMTQRTASRYRGFVPETGMVALVSFCSCYIRRRTGLR